MAVNSWDYLGIHSAYSGSTQDWNLQCATKTEATVFSILDPKRSQLLHVDEYQSAFCSLRGICSHRHRLKNFFCRIVATTASTSFGSR
ncbi:hypothetical protein BST61_g7884 [Cercospora zeina]